MTTQQKTEEKTLNQVLTEKGYTTGLAPGIYKKTIFSKGVEVFRGNAGQVWSWLKALEAPVNDHTRGISMGSKYANQEERSR